MTDTQATEAPTEAPTADTYAPAPYRAKAPKGNPGGGRYALWSHTEERYVADDKGTVVHDKRPSSKAGHTVVEV